MRLSLLLAVLAAGSAALAQQRNFVACPIVRDTKTVPCYLAEYDGETYFLGIQQDITSEFHPPQLKHEVLVEGRIAAGDGNRVCGGIPLQPVSVSVLKEVNLACDVLLPAEPSIEAPPAALSAGPHRSEPAIPSSARTGKDEFTILYAFNDDFLDYGATRVLEEAAAYAKSIGAIAVKVTGYRATSLLSNGTSLVEKAGLAEKRAQNIATLLRGLGVGAVVTEWKSEAVAGDGQSDPSHRRVSIDVTPQDAVKARLSRP